MTEYEWIRPDMNLYHISGGNTPIITVSNSGDLEADFYKYAQNFYEAAEDVIHYLAEEAAKKYDIAKLDLWYFATVYLYRQSLELLLKASIFQTVTNTTDRKDIIGNIRHDLKQSFEKLIELRGLTIDGNENAKWVMDFLSDISRTDKESDMFRYPFGSNFRKLFEKQTHISLVATHDNMNKAYMVIKEVRDAGYFSTEDYVSYSPQMIIEGGYYYQQSVVGYEYYRNSFFPYFTSYLEVGDFLKDKIITHNKADLFMPMCYLYRNAVELGLKRLIVEDSHIDNAKSIRITQRKKHSILGLWNSIADEIREYANVLDDDTTIEDAQRYIQTFHDFDQSSDLFRYPCNKNLEPYFLDAKKFDVENVASCFKELCNFLDAVDGMLSDIRDYEAAMAYDYY